MATRSQREKGQTQNANQVILSGLLKEDCNKYCSDCGAKGPRWASWNLGVFLCIRCAGIHRNLGVHISKVKSVNLDSWTPEQMSSIQEWGNRRAGLYWECFLPKDFNRPQTNSAVESFIRNKYEHKKYSKKDGLPPKADFQESNSVSSKNKTEKVVKRKKPIDEKNGFSMPVKEVAAPAKTTASVSRPKPRVQTSQSAAAPVTTHAVVEPNPPSQDLLSLDTPTPAVNQTPLVIQQTSTPSSAAVNELIDFGSFQGAPQILSHSPPSQPQQFTNMTQSATAIQNGESLLKDDSSSNKSTKDSIMALYTGSGSSAAQQPHMYGVPGGMYIQPQPQMQKSSHNMYSAPLQMPYHPQLHVTTPHMQQHLMQHPSPKQQQQLVQLSQIQQQMQQLKLQKNQPNSFQQQQQQQQQQSLQQPNNMYSKNMFTPQQAMNTLMTQQHAMHYQQHQQSQFISTGPSSNILPMNGMPSSGHTLNNQLWK